MKKFILSLACLLCLQITFAQNLTNEGTEFYVAFPEVYDHANAVFEINISSRTNANGNVSIAGTGFTQNFTVVPGVVTTVTLPPADANIIFSEVVLNRAIHVTADVPVTVYASTFHNARSEASICLPVTAFASDYMVTTYPTVLKSGVWYQSEFTVVAGNQACDVTIIPSCNTDGGVLAGTPIPVHLDPNEIYMVKAQTGANNDLTGTTITADNGTDEFAVYNGHVWIYLSSCGNLNADPLFEQCYPTKAWGTAHILTMTEEQNDNAFRVIAKDNGTTFMVDGVPTGPVLNAGDVYDGNFVLPTEAILIESNKPVAVTQTMTTGVCSGNGDPSMVVINSNEQMYLDTVTFYAATGGSSLANYVNVVTRSADTSTMQMNAAAINGWTLLPADNDYSYKIMSTTVGSHTLTTTGCGFLAYAYGMGNPESYFYAAGARVNSIDDSLSFTNINTSQAGLCDLDSIHFTPFTSGGNVLNYNWYFGDGDSSNVQDPIHTYANAGTYTVTLIVEYLCFTDTIVEDIDVYDSPQLTGTVTDVTCYNWGDGAVSTTITNGTPNYNYLWSTGSTATGISGLNGGNYWLVVTDQNGCEDSIYVTVQEPLAINVNVNPAGPFAPPDGVQSLSGSPAGGTWTASCGACINSTTGDFDPLIAGDGTWQVCYTVTVGGCDSTACIDIVVSSTCALVAYGNDPTCFGLNDGSFTVNTSGGAGTINYLLTDANGSQVNVSNTNTANQLVSGWYYINVTDDICTFEDSIFIDQPAEMIIDLDLTHILCNGDLTGVADVVEVFNYTGHPDSISYFWAPSTPSSNGIGQNVYSQLGAGSYLLTINDQNGCTQSLDFDINEPSPLVLDLGFEPSQCRVYSYQNGNGVVYASATGGSPAYTFYWENVYTLQNSNNSTWGGLNPSLYSITVTDVNGCTIQEFITLDSLNPIADFTVTSPEFLDPGVCEGTAVVNANFVNTSQNYIDPSDVNSQATFFWTLDSANGNPWYLTHDFLEQLDTAYGEGGLYTACIKVINDNGCEDDTCKQILVFDKPELILPNVFTPGGDDDVNNVFFFPQVAIVELECVVVNRWGRTIFEFTDPSQSWDGTDKSGSECPDGVYFYTYKAKATNGTEFEGQGNIHLIRP